MVGTGKWNQRLWGQNDRNEHNEFTARNEGDGRSQPHRLLAVVQDGNGAFAEVTTQKNAELVTGSSPLASLQHRVNVVSDAISRGELTAEKFLTT